ncbi:MAG TPA: hypothetical protein VNR66_07880, partial [Solirubrobacteraceae bacterium]|nr:hypothetical protein [Solirubrobacteraceae bacterium]
AVVPAGQTACGHSYVKVQMSRTESGSALPSSVPVVVNGVSVLNALATSARAERFGGSTHI